MKNRASLFLGFMLVCEFVCSQDLKKVTPGEAFDLTKQPATYLIDVRSVAEYVLVGHPTMAINIPLSFWDEKQQKLVANENFLQDLKRRFKVDDTLIFMCRSGGRSQQAAQAALGAGFQKILNLGEGFEGQSDEKGYHTVGGWKNSSLPYTFDLKEDLAYPKAGQNPTK